MKKSDLKKGNVVELRNGKFYVLVNAYNESILIALTGIYHFKFDNYYKDLTYTYGFENFDIMKVYKDYTCKELLWERKEKSQLTENEKVILRNIDKCIKYIARNMDGSLLVYEDKPVKAGEHWDCEFQVYYFPFDKLFQFIQWEDEEPYSIEELLKGEEK